MAFSQGMQALVGTQPLAGVASDRAQSLAVRNLWPSGAKKPDWKGP